MGKDELKTTIGKTNRIFIVFVIVLLSALILTFVLGVLMSKK